MARVKVKYTKGMFPIESLVTVHTTSGPVEFYVDNVHLVEDELRVDIIDTDDTQALIRLPVEPMWGGRNVVVKLEDIVE